MLRQFVLLTAFMCSLFQFPTAHALSIVFTGPNVNDTSQQLTSELQLLGIMPDGIVLFQAKTGIPYVMPDSKIVGVFPLPHFIQDDGTEEYSGVYGFLLPSGQLFLFSEVALDQAQAEQVGLGYTSDGVATGGVFSSDLLSLSFDGSSRFLLNYHMSMLYMPDGGLPTANLWLRNEPAQQTYLELVQ